jgi:uncharacterized membrane protein
VAKEAGAKESLSGTSAAFGRFAILLLSFEWIVFGSMHFSLVDATVAQMPAWLPFKREVAIVTGIAEVAAGILILVAETRKGAAIASLSLLVLLFPAMYHILDDPNALAGSSPAGAAAFRTCLIPNNILLAICSIYLVRHPDSSLWANAMPDSRERHRVARGRPWEPITFFVPALLLMANCAGFLALAVGLPGHFALASLWAMSCIATGALIGFLFGVPRLNPQAQVKDRLLPNTNVEAVSDWLTKILVGVGLVNFQAIGAFVGRLSDDFARASGSDRAFGASLIVYFFVVGVIEGYVLTRLFLAPRFEAITDPETPKAITGRARLKQPAAARSR